MFIMLSESALPKLTWRVSVVGDSDAGWADAVVEGFCIKQRFFQTARCAQRQRERARII
jgi:hypothetical protein